MKIVIVLFLIFEEDLSNQTEILRIPRQHSYHGNMCKISLWSDKYEREYKESFLLIEFEIWSPFSSGTGIRSLHQIITVKLNSGFYVDVKQEVCLYRKPSH